MKFIVRNLNIVFFLILLIFIILFHACFKYYPNTIQTAKQDLRNLKYACELYYKKYNKYPLKEDGLAVLLEFLNYQKIPIDPWGKPYIYLFPGHEGFPYEIYSTGKDLIDGSDDDLSMREL